MVRFAKPDEINIRDSRSWNSEPKPYIGILIEHDKLMGVVQVLYEGQIFKLRSVFVQKAGRKDYEAR